MKALKFCLVPIGVGILYAPPTESKPIRVSPEVIDSEAISAYRDFWSQFELYENQRRQDHERKFQLGWSKLRESYDKQKRRLDEQQVTSLKEAAENYRASLEKHRGAPNRPFVMFNMAQVLNKLGLHYLAEGDNEGLYYRNRALVYLKDLGEQHPGFAKREAAMYLRAIILQTTGKDQEAKKVWRRLARMAERSLYGVHARIASGDDFFTSDDPRKALREYEGALSLLDKIEVRHHAYERVRILYRLAWASYRSAKTKDVLNYGSQLLVPGLKMKSLDVRKQIQKDATELMGDILFETDDLDLFSSTIGKRELLDFGPAIALRTMQRYSANGIHLRVGQVGEIAARQFPAALEIPRILKQMAISYDDLGRKAAKVNALEQLAMLLPKRSLWRSRHANDFQAIADMEKSAREAARFAAAHHYDYGLASGRASSFIKAASFYEMLLADQPSGESSLKWRLRRGHCYYFGQRYADAAKIYNDLINQHKLPPTDLETAMYQLVLTTERLWRNHYATALRGGKDPNEDRSVIGSLADLDARIDRYANRFPSQSRSIDLLLVAAGANRDHGFLAKASKYWQRALVSSPSPAQRVIAIRGIVLEKLKNGSSREIVDTSRRFLRLEDWEELGLTLGTELEGVLSTSVQEEGNRLNDTGEIRKGGALLVEVAREFKDVPDRDKIYRDGAYMLAIAGDWNAAEGAARSYLQAGLKKNAGDMTYLLGRSFEYQLAFHDASKQYVVLGRKFQKHPRTRKSLARAETLALAEKDYVLAATAAELLGDQTRNRKQRLMIYSRAIDHSMKADDPDRGLKVARKRLKSSRALSQRLTSQLWIAKLRFKKGEESQALADLEKIGAQADRQRSKLNKESYTRLAGETYFLLGEEARRQFEDFDVVERSGSVAKNVDQKAKYFEKLSTLYDKSAASGSFEFGTQARYRLAEAAEQFADEIAQVPTRAKQAINLKTSQRFNDYVKRLQRLAKKYYGNNLIVKQKNPGRLKNNEWVAKSARKLTGYGEVQHVPKYDEQLPNAANLDLPYQWSL